MNNAALKTIMESMIEKRYYEGACNIVSDNFEETTENMSDEVYAIISEELKDKFCMGFAEGVLFMAQLQQKIK